MKTTAELALFNNEEKVKAARKMYLQSEYLQCLELLQGIENNNKKSQQIKGLCCFQQSEFEEAKNIFIPLIENMSKAQVIESIDIINLIQFLMQMNYEDEKYTILMLPALIQFNESFQSQMKQNNTLLEQGVLLWAKGVIIYLRENDDWKKSIELLKESISFVEEYKEEILIQIAYIYLNQNQLKDAIYYNNQVLEINNKNFEAYANQGYCYKLIFDQEQAMKCYLQAETLNKCNNVNLRNISTLLEKMNKFQEAEIYAKKAIEMQPTYEKGYLRLSTLYLSTSRKEEAISFMTKQFEQSPSIKKATFLLHELTEIQQLNTFIDKTEKLIPQNKGDLFYKKGWFQYSNNQLEEALESFQVALDSPRTETHTYKIHYVMAFSFQQLEFHQNAIDQLILCLSDSSSKYMHEKEAKIIGFLFRSMQSVDNYKFFLQYYSDHPKYLALMNTNFQNDQLPNCFQSTLELFRNFLMVITFEKEIRDYLVFKPKASLWDLFLD